MLKLDINTGSGWAAVDFAAVGLGQMRLQISYSHPAQLTFTLAQPQHTSPIPSTAAVRLWPEGENDASGAAFSAANPLFLGFVSDIEPQDSNTLAYTCLDPTAAVNSAIPIMSTTWDTPTTQLEGGVPRLIFNPSIDTDQDWSFARGYDLTVGQIISVILDDAKLPLETLFAAPGSGDPYLASDLEGMTFVPQEKIVFTSEPIRAGVARLLEDWQPKWRLLFDPASRRWRFGDISQSQQVTYTLNDFSPAAEHPILKLNLDRSLDGRYTAVKIYGPEAVENTDITIDGGGLVDVSDDDVILDTFGAGVAVYGKHKFQIVDEDKRRMGRLLATAIYAPLEEVRIGPNAFTQFALWTRTPTLMAKWKNNSAGTDAWQTCTGWNFDQTTGIIDFRDAFLYRYNANPEVEDSILQPNYENPEDVRLVYPSYIEPLFVRVPASGFEGTAFTDHGLERELKIYDESLAVGWLFGTPVTSETRLEKFQVLAAAILDTTKDALYHGGMTLEGLDYEFHRLDRRINLAAVDGDGQPLTTGWETIQAILTDVEYDFEEQTTVVNFSSDQSQLLGFDPERIKQDLRIGAAYISQVVTAYAVLGTERRFTEFGTPFIAQTLTVGGGITPVIVDPYFGTIDPLITNDQ